MAVQDGVVRVTLGISLERVAKWAGVGRDTVRMYEANPRAVGEDTRAACAEVYRVLRDALGRLERPRVSA
jgi:predicted transcriptional regulator